MGIFDSIDETEKDPEFGKLSYDAQMIVRSRMAERQLPQDPQFMSLGQDAQAEVLRRIVFRDPVFDQKDIDAGKWLNTLATSKTNIAQYIKESEAKAANPISGGAIATIVKRSLPGAASPLSYNHLMSKFIADNPIIKTIYTGIGKGMQFLFNLWDDVHVAQGKLDPSQLAGRRLDAEANINNARKLAAWEDIQAGKDQELAAIAMVSSTGMGIAGTAWEMATLGKILQGSMGSPAGITKLIQGAGKSVALDLPRWTQRIFAVGSYAAAGAVINMGRETLRDIVSPGTSKYSIFAGNPALDAVFLRSGKYLGEGVLWDAGLTTIMSGLPKAGRALSWTVFGPPKSASSKLLAQFVSKGELVENFKVAFQEDFVNALTGKRIDDIAIKAIERNNPWYAAVMRNNMALGRTMQNVERASPWDILQAAAITNGHVVEEVGSKIKLSQVLGGGDFKSATFGTVDDAYAALLKEVDTIHNLKPAQMTELGIAAGKMELKKVVTAALPEGHNNAGAILTSLAAPVGGKFDPNRVRQFSRELLRVNGAGKDVLDSVVANIVDDKIIVKAGDKVVEIPRLVTDSLAEKDAISALTKISDLAPTGAQKMSSQSFITQYDDLVKSSRVHYTPAWLEETVATNWNGRISKVAEGKFQLDIPDETPQIFTNYDDLGNYVLKNKMMDEKSFVAYLNTYEGLQVLKTKAGLQVRDRTKQIVAEGATFQDILAKNPELTPKIPAEYAPQQLFIVDDAPKVVFEKGIAKGNITSLLEEMEKFRDYKKVGSTIDFLGGRMKFDQAESVFEVSFPELGFSQTFKDKTEAVKFLKKGANDVTTMSLAAWNKGYFFEVTGNQWEVYTKDATKIFKTREEAAAFLKTAPRQPFVPELTGLDKEFYKDLNLKAYNDPDPFFKQTIQHPVELGPAWDFQAIMPNFRTTEGSLEAAAKKAGKIGGEGPQMALKTFREMEQTKKFFNIAGSEANGMVEQIFKKGGKSFNDETEIAIGKLMGNNLDDPGIAKLAEGLGLGPEHIETARTARTYLNNAQFFFGVNPDTLLSNYLPLMKKYLQVGDMSKYTDDKIMDFIRDAAGGQAVKDLTPSFKHARISDLPTMIMEENPRTLLKNYITMGLKEKWFGPVVEHWGDWISKNKGMVDNGLKLKMEAYFQDVLGLPTSVTDKGIRVFTGKLFKALGAKSPPQNIIDSMIRLGYGSTLAFRLYPMVRNLSQPWLMLAPRIGNDWLASGYEILSKEPERGLAIMEKLYGRGSIPTDLPFHESSEVFGKGGAIGKLIKKGMEGYGNGDAFGRCVSYLAVEERFNWALGQMNAGKFGMDKFLNQSGAWNLADDLRKDFMDNMKAGNIDGARHLFASKLTDEAMINYGKGLLPNVYRGTLGRLFGQFGTYVVNYTQNMRNMFSRATWGQRVAVTARIAANSAAFAGAATAIGLRAGDFLPWNTNFSGGIYWSLMSNMLKLTQDSYDGRMARAKVLGVNEQDGQITFDVDSFMRSDIVKGFVPGSLEFNSIRNGIEYWNKGDYGRFLLSISSAPVKK
jgi:hypothetical protein